MVYSAHSKMIAAGHSGGDGGSVMVWDADTHTRLVDKPFPLGRDYVSSVAFSPDGNTIVVGVRSGGTADVGGVVLWDVDLESWQRRAGQIANRNLSRKEWRDYFPEAPYHTTFPDLPVPPEATSK